MVNTKEEDENLKAMRVAESFFPEYELSCLILQPLDTK